MEGKQTTEDQEQLLQSPSTSLHCCLLRPSLTVSLNNSLKPGYQIAQSNEELEETLCEGTGWGGAANQRPTALETTNMKNGRQKHITQNK